MSFIATLTGSYPPVSLLDRPLTDEELAASLHLFNRYLTNEEMITSIRNAVRHQQEAIRGKSINWVFVSGQPQSDIVSIFARGLGLGGDVLPYKVTQEIRPSEPITLRELEIANEAAGGQPLKAHITGPTLMAQTCDLTCAPPRYQGDPENRRQLTLDFAYALAEEARSLIQAPHLPIAYLQIDEPTLTKGANLDLAHEAIQIIADVSRASNVPVILHACGDIGGIMESLLNMPVDILNVEYHYLRRVSWLNAERLSRYGKQLALGCMAVNTDEVPTVRQIGDELLAAEKRYGAEHIWGITPNCGQRMAEPSIARQRLNRLAEVAAKVAPRFER